MVIKRVRYGIKNVLGKKTIDETVIEGARAIKREVRKHIITSITAALGFLIALYWKGIITLGVNGFVERFSLSGWLY